MRVHISIPTDKLGAYRGERSDALACAGLFKLRIKIQVSADQWVNAVALTRETAQIQLVGLGKPAILQACFAGP